MITSISIKRNRIAFEHMESCLCGNSHQEAAQSAWLDAASAIVGDLVIDAEIGYDNDPGAVGRYVESQIVAAQEEESDEEALTWAMDGPKIHCITSGHYDEPPPAEVIAAFAALDAADDAAMEAAYAAYIADCSTTDEDWEAVEAEGQARAEVARAEAQAAYAAAVDRAAKAASLPAELVARLLAMPDRSRSTRRRTWRAVRTAAGEEVTRMLQAVVPPR